VKSLNITWLNNLNFERHLASCRRMQPVKGRLNIQMFEGMAKADIILERRGFFPGFCWMKRKKK